MTGQRRDRTGLVLTGAGAWAAYEAGVLKALGEIRNGTAPPPLSIYCGASGGALNAMLLAQWAPDFAAAVGELLGFWSEITPDQVFRPAKRPLLAPFQGRGLSGWPLFDTAPLRETLAGRLESGRLEEAIARQALRAACITCCGMSSGQSVSFFQGRADLDPWHGVRRAGTFVVLEADHVLASMAMPLMFPPVRLHREYFCDGAHRERAPLAPAIRLGADRIVAIATSPAGSAAEAEFVERAATDRSPGMLETLAHVLVGGGADCLEADVARVAEINRLHACPAGDGRPSVAGPPRRIDTLVIRPARSLSALAIEHFEDLPGAIRARIPTRGRLSGGRVGTLIGNLLFQKSFTQKLIDHGFRDAMSRRAEIVDFFSPPQDIT